MLAALATGLYGLIDLRLGFFGWLIAFWVGSLVGAMIADAAYRLAGKRRGRYSWLVVAGGVAIGGFVVSLAFIMTISKLIFVVMAISGAIGRLRLSR